MIVFYGEQIEAARQGNRAALDAIVRAAERPVYNLALRMLANRADAEDATQEILIKIVTHIGTLRDVNAAGAWAMQIACRDLVNRRKRGRVEAMRLTFEGFAADLDTGRRDLAEGAMTDAETTLALEEVKVGCTLAMLTCLNRPARMAYVLGEIFELTDKEAANALEITPTAFRQRLTRARKAVTSFVTKTCGVVSEKNPCRCVTRIAPALEQKRIAKGASQFDLDQIPTRTPNQVSALVRSLEDGRAAAALMRSNPDFPSQMSDMILPLLDVQPDVGDPVQ
ncbi:sigma-70 family RNA polymerase sigma factor [Epibacterium ulvae]|uniref:RNA polymerase sigma factor n=1 Tax=Epibacterium ulvae TaxID=1156985 RepID=UPI001BFC5008|nr:sigma-70 family RNA polymerase sigma factor [Epibacterium ulvae]MBT8155106.1 sigma-70 family RNA polymerase sigma factor [Epibacterium ulvae]